LSSGKPGGVFKFVPKRGSDPVQTVYFRYINQNGDETVASKEFTLQVAADLDPEVKFLASNAGIKKWKWDLSVNNQAWGNCAYCMGDGADFAVNGANQWWGCEPEALWSKKDDYGQYGHTDGDDSKAGEGDRNAYMTFDEAGKVTTFDANGKELRSASCTLELFGTRADVGGNPWNIGTLKTSAPAIMFPYMINGKGTTVTDFEVLELTGTSLVLVYPGASQPGSWAEATFWRFMKKK
jgi:hypothetical protein